MKEERKEKNRKSHTGSVKLEHRSTPLSEAGCADCVQPWVPHCAMRAGWQGRTPRGARVCQPPQCPPNAAPRSRAWKGHPV